MSRTNAWYRYEEISPENQHMFEYFAQAGLKKLV